MNDGPTARRIRFSRFDGRSQQNPIRNFKSPRRSIGEQKPKLRPASAPDRQRTQP